MYVCRDVEINSHRGIMGWFYSFASRTTRVRTPVEPTFITHPESRQTRAHALTVMCIAGFWHRALEWDGFGRVCGGGGSG
jgi:hypothetical protein